MRFVLTSTSATGSNVYAGFEDSSANSSRAATLLINPPLPTIVSSGGWGTAPTPRLPDMYIKSGHLSICGDAGGDATKASTLLLFLGDYYNFDGQSISQPSVTDSCGNTWSILAGPTDWAGYFYYQRGTVYYVENPLACPAGDTITMSDRSSRAIGAHLSPLPGRGGIEPLTNPSRICDHESRSRPGDVHRNDRFPHSSWRRAGCELDLRRL